MGAEILIIIVLDSRLRILVLIDSFLFGLRCFDSLGVDCLSAIKVLLFLLPFGNRGLRISSLNRLALFYSHPSIFRAYFFVTS
jgi:hypothetical protein